MKQASRNSRHWKRALALTLAFFCLASVFSGPVRTALAADDGYGRVTDDNVKVRKTSSTSSGWWFKLPKDWVSEILGTTTREGISWYKVKTYGPTQGTHTYIGYIHGGFFQPMTEAEQEDWLKNPVQPGVGVIGAPETPSKTPASTPGGMTPKPGTANPTPIPDPSDLGRINKSGVNFRERPNGPVMYRLDKGTVVNLLDIPDLLTEDQWFKILYDGDTGYIQADLLTILTRDEAEEYESQSTSSGSSGTVYGYIRLLYEGINLRQSPGGSVITRIDEKPVMAFYKAPVKEGRFTWYYVKTQNGVQGYVRSDVADVTDSGGDTAPPPATPSPNPGQTPASDTVHGYIKLDYDATNLRRSPGGSVILRIDGKPVMAYLSEPRREGRFSWYYVKLPGGIYGYLRSDVVSETNGSGNVTQSPDVSPTPAATPEASSFGYVKLTTDKVNLRKTPNGLRLCFVNLGDVLPLTSDPKESGAYQWYPVESTDGVKGYIRGDMASPCDQNGTTAAPTPSPSVDPIDAAGYVMVNMKSVNLRRSIGGRSIMTLDKGTVLPMVAAAVKSGNYTWYPVDVNGTKGFLRSDASYQLSAFQAEAYLRGEGVPTPSPSPTPAPGPSSYLVTVLDKVNLRTSASKDARAPYNVALGTVMAYSGSNTAGGSLWYKIEYEDTDVWVLGSCVKVMNTKEYSEWLAAQPTPTPTPSPTPTPKPEDLSDMAETSLDNVLVRAAGLASSRQVSKIYQKGTIVTLNGKTNVDDGYTWYGVKLQSGTIGYIRGDLLRIYTKDEKKQYENSHNNTGSNGKQEATYETLRRGSTGEAVKKLQAGLKEQGYYNGSISGTYGSDTVDAVKDFQRAKGLTVDGIAGANTQHALFGTVPVGSSDGELTNTIYPVEKIDWWTGGINTIWSRGMNVKVTDVKTGITFWAHRWAGANHVDAEPLTAADTRRMCKIYGVSSAQEIEDKNLYQRRALWVTVGTRTFAASMYGVPHNYPAGDTIANNEYRGQFCIHFTNSKTHTSNRVDPTHSSAIQYAYDAFHNHHSSTFVVRPY